MHETLSTMMAGRVVCYSVLLTGKCLRNGSFLIWWTLWLPDILGFRFIVVLTLNDAVFLLHLCDIEVADFQSGMFQNIRLDFLIGCLFLRSGQI